MELKQGKADKCERWLDQLKGILEPVMKSSNKPKLSKECIQKPLFIEHPETCECVSCIDAALHIILINYIVSVAKYLSFVSRPEQSISFLEVAESVCQCAEQKLAKCLERLDIVLCGNESSESTLKETKKKGRAKTAKGRKQKEDTAMQSFSIPQLMMSQYNAILYCMNAEVLLQNGKVEKASYVLAGALEIVCCAESVTGNSPMHLLPIKASLLHLYGVTTLLLKSSSSGCSMDFNWFSKTKLKHISVESTVDVLDSVTVDVSEECEVEKPRKGSSRRGRNAKTAEKTSVEDTSKPKSTRAKGRGKSKKMEGTLTECDESEVSSQRKTKGCKRPVKSSKPPTKVMDDNQTGMTINEVTRYTVSTWIKNDDNKASLTKMK